MADIRSNPFQRYAYSPLNAGNGAYKNIPVDQTIFPETFSGGDLQAFINNQKVPNLESITWSISTEIVGNYVMGRRDPMSYTKGKRVIVGSMAFQQWDRHAILEQIYQLSTRGVVDQYDLWNTLGGAPASQIIASQDWSIFTTNKGVNLGNGSTEPTGQGQTIGIGSGVNSFMRGLSQTAWEQELRQQARQTAALIGAQRLSYTDMLPPFDITIVGVNPGGAASFCTIFGIAVSQETAGWSMNDLNNTMGVSFAAMHVSPWRPILGDAANQMAQSLAGRTG